MPSRRPPARLKIGSGPASVGAAPAAKRRGTSAVTPIERLRQSLVQERRVSRALQEVGLAIGSMVDLDQILELILDKIRDVLDADRVTLFFLEDGEDELVSRLVVGESVRTIRVRVGEGLAGRVAKTGKPLRVRDAYKDRRFSPEWDNLTGYRTRSILAAPMHNHVGSIIGVVQVLNKVGDGVFTKEDADLLAALATQAAITVDNSRLYLSTLQKNTQLVAATEQLKHRVRDLKLLFDLESSMARATSLEELLRAALTEALVACDGELGAVLLTDETTDASTAYVVRAEQPEHVRRIMMSPGEGFLGSVMLYGQAVLAAELPYNRKEAQRTDDLLGIRVRSAVGVPLGPGPNEQIVGAIALYNKGQRKGAKAHFSADDTNLVRLIAANVSTAVELCRSRGAQEQAERLTTIGKLLSSVIHDLKTPMTVISGYVQLMVDENDSQKRATYTEFILRQFDLVQQMQKEVLEFARGETSVLVRRVYLQNFLRSFEQSIRPTLQGLAIVLEVIADDRGIARFDEAKVIRALHNLVRNAVDAMGPKGGRLVVRVGRTDEGIVFSVSDSGPGIPPEIRGRLFESFVTSGKKGGTGLGLAIVKKITEEHGGRAEVETSPQGTTFRLVLPQAAPVGRGGLTS